MLYASGTAVTLPMLGRLVGVKYRFVSGNCKFRGRSILAAPMRCRSKFVVATGVDLRRSWQLSQVLKYVVDKLVFLGVTVTSK